MRTRNASACFNIIAPGVDDAAVQRIERAATMPARRPVAGAYRIIVYMTEAAAIRERDRRLRPDHRRRPLSAAMRVAVFSTKAYDRRFLDAANRGFGHRHRLFRGSAGRQHGRPGRWLPGRLRVRERPRGRGRPGGPGRGRDPPRGSALRRIQQCRPGGRRSGLGVAVVRVPAYSPEAVAEFTIGLILALDRNIPAPGTGSARTTSPWTA